MDSVLIKVKRQDDPEGLPYWEKFEVPFTQGMTVADVLQGISENPKTLEENDTPPIGHEISCREGICGSCTMVINGRVAQACRTMVESLRKPITIEPMSKFPVIRDLIVDRSRMFKAIETFKCWIEIDGLHDLSAESRRLSPAKSREVGNLSGCIMCGSCIEACPQINSRSPFIGAFIFSCILALNLMSDRSDIDGVRLSAAMQRGGVMDCGGAENCEKVCPGGIDLPAAISRLGLIAGRYSLRNFLRG